MSPKREPLPSELLEPEFERFECWIFVTEEMSKALKALPHFARLMQGQRSFLISTHRVGPRKLFDLPGRAGFPSEYQIEQARAESLRCAQAKALKLMQIDGVQWVTIRSWKRKAASGRFERGQGIGALIGTLKTPDDRVIYGEPTEKALAIDAEWQGS